MSIKNVSVIGSGTMGNGIAHVFAQSGFTVNLIDVNPSQLQRALATITKNLDRQVAKGTLTEDQKKSTLVLSIEGQQAPVLISMRMFKRLFAAGRLSFLETAPLFERAVDSVQRSADMA